MTVLKAFEKLQSTRNELENGERQRENLLSSGEDLEKLIGLFDKFNEMRSELTEKEDLKGNLEKKLRALEKDIEQAKREVLSSQSALEGLVKEETDLLGEREALPKLEKDLQQVALDITEKEKIIEALEESVSKSQGEKDLVDERIREL